MLNAVYPQTKSENVENLDFDVGDLLTTHNAHYFDLICQQQCVNVRDITGLFVKHRNGGLMEQNTTKRSTFPGIRA